MLHRLAHADISSFALSYHFFPREVVLPHVEGNTVIIIIMIAVKCKLKVILCIFSISEYPPTDFCHKLVFDLKLGVVLL